MRNDGLRYVAKSEARLAVDFQGLIQGDMMRIIAALRAVLAIAAVSAVPAGAQVRPQSAETGSSFTIAVVRDGPAAMDVSEGVERCRIRETHPRRHFGQLEDT